MHKLSATLSVLGIGAVLAFGGAVADHHADALPGADLPCVRTMAIDTADLTVPLCYVTPKGSEMLSDGTVVPVWMLENFTDPCKSEDGPGPCYWDATKRGNGTGQSFAIHDDGRVAYVIPPAPVVYHGDGYLLVDADPARGLQWRLTDPTAIECIRYGDPVPTALCAAAH